MKVVVDFKKCQDHAQCVMVAPEIFSQDAEGNLVFDASPDDSLLDAAEEAADVCPTQAISIQA